MTTTNITPSINIYLLQSLISENRAEDADKIRMSWLCLTPRGYDIMQLWAEDQSIELPDYCNADHLANFA
jgi:hypothetical protein